MATEAIQSEYQILFNDAVKSVNTFINTLDSKLASVGSSTKSDISSKIESGFDGLGGRLGRIFDTAFGTVLGGAIQNGIGQINNLLTSGFDATINFDAQISSIKALTGATGAELEKIKNASLQAGKDTKFSALEAAQGFEELLKAGVSLDAILAGGLTGALDLAVAGGIAVGDAAEIASTGLNTFAKDGLSVTRVADILAGTANASATSVGELKFALSSVGVVSAQASQSLESTSIALGIFAQNGLKGSDAGTSLKTFLNNLIPTTKRARETLTDLGIVLADGTNKFINANGSFKSLSEISQVLTDATLNLSDSQKSLALETVFGSDAVRAASILAKTGSVEFTKFADAINKIKAADVAKEKLNNLKGAFETLKGSIETNQILLLGGLQPALTQLTKGFDGFINSIDFSKVGESLSSFVSTAIKESTNLFNLLFNGEFTGLFGLEEDNSAIDFLNQIRNTALGLYDVLFSGTINNTPIFGLAEDSGVVTFLIDLRNTITGIVDILFFNKYDRNLFGIGEDSKVAEFFFNIRDTFLKTTDLVRKNPLDFSFPDLKPIIESIAGLGNSVIPLVDKIGNSTVFKTVVGSIALIADAIIRIGLPALIDQITNLFILISSNQSVLDSLLIAVTGIGAGFATFSILASVTATVTALSTALTLAGGVAGIFAAGLTFVTAPITLIAIGIGLLVVGVILLYKNWDIVTKFLTDSWNTVSKFLVDGFNSVVSSLTSFGSSVQKGFEDAFNGVKDIVSNVFNSVVSSVTGFISNIVTGITNFSLTLFTAVQAFFQPIIDIFTNVFGIIGNIINLGWLFLQGLFVTAIQSIIAIFTGNFDQLGVIWNNFFVFVGQLLQAFVTGTQAKFKEIGDVVLGVLNDFFDNVKIIFQAGLDLAIAIVLGFKDAVINGFNLLVDGVLVIFDLFKLGVVIAFNFLTKTIPNTINSFKDSAINTFNNLKDGVVNALTGLPDKVGKIFNDLKDGAVNTFNNLIDTIKNLLSNIKLPELKFPEIKLPSIPSFASGTNFFEGGLARFGERGRELLQFPNGLQSLVNQDTTGFLPRGTRILNNQDTNRYLRANSTVNIPQLPNPKPDLSTVSNRNVSNVNTNNQSSQNNSNNNYTNYGNNYQMSAVNKYSF